MSDVSLEQLVSKIGNAQIKKALIGAINEKIQTKIYCLSRVCQGRMIGFINMRGVGVADEKRNKFGKLVSGMFATRPRMDGQLGVECACGNDSRIAKQEKGILKANGRMPSNEGVVQIYKNIEKNPTKVILKDGKLQVDGFLIERIS